LILYILAGMFERGFVPEFPVFLDSPMAIEATNIYTRHPELFDAEAAERSRNRYFIKDFRSLQLCRTADESRALNDLSGPCLIMAGAGMCNAGRILHHFRQNLWKKETWVLIVGYQARGSLGRLLVEGVKKVRIFGETIAVKAAVRTLGGFSAHAGQKDLLNWFECLAPARPRLFLTHGEPPAQQALAEEIERRFKIRAATPGMRETIEL
ncbi:MAG: MBL fold metallo-hydrolase, partial [Verrucomicrobia bacterium]|nr:MBL fold metallo-hydrolase [Verrucomicrobiota bacterium]